MDEGSAQGPVLVVVDDVAALGEVAKEHLEAAFPRSTVVVFEEPAPALAWLRGAPRVDLVLSDLRMARGDGVALLREAAGMHPGAALCLMTAYPELPLPPGELAAMGVLGLLKKPWEWKPFTAFLREVLSHSGSARARIRASGPLEFPRGSFTGPDAVQSPLDGASASGRAGAVSGGAAGMSAARPVRAGDAGGAERELHKVELKGAPTVKCPHCGGGVPLPTAPPAPPTPPATPSAPATLPPVAPRSPEEEATRILAYLRAKPKVRDLVLGGPAGKG